MPMAGIFSIQLFDPISAGMILIQLEPVSSFSFRFFNSSLKIKSSKIGFPGRSPGAFCWSIAGVGANSIVFLVMVFVFLVLFVRWSLLAAMRQSSSEIPVCSKGSVLSPCRHKADFT